MRAGRSCLLGHSVQDKAASGKPGAQHIHGDHAAAPADRRTEIGKQWPLMPLDGSKELGKTVDRVRITDSCGESQLDVSELPCLTFMLLSAQKDIAPSNPQGWG